METAVELSPDAPGGLGALAVAYAEAGQREKAESIGMRLSAQAAVGYVPAVTRAEVAMALGQADAALRFLDQAVGGHEPLVVYVGVDPLYAPLRDDPRFAALLRGLGLPQRR